MLLKCNSENKNTQSTRIRIIENSLLSMKGGNNEFLKGQTAVDLHVGVKIYPMQNHLIGC